MAFFTNRLGAQGPQPRQNLHVIDNGFLTRLYNLEEASHATDSEVDAAFFPMRDSRPMRQRQQVSHKGPYTHLFQQALDMFSRDHNLLVIPESVLREYYANTFKDMGVVSNPFINTQDGGWAWNYSEHKQIAQKRPLIRQFWDDKALLLSHYLHEGFEQSQISVFPDAQALANQLKDGPLRSRIVIVRDRAQNGDDAIKDIIAASRQEDSPNLTVLTCDKRMVQRFQSLEPIRRDVLFVDIAPAMAAYCQKSVETRHPWPRASMSALFKLTHARNKSFRDGSISHAAWQESNAFVKALTSPDVVDKERK